MQTQLFKSPTLAEVELTYKTKVKPSDMPKITSCIDINQYLRSLWSDEKIEHVEEFKILLLNRANKILGWFQVSTGGLAGTVADPKVIFQAAITSNASALVIAHNHPSGNLSPSQADITLTRKIKEAGKLLDLPLLDHVILTSEGYYSFADEGVL